MYLHMATEIRNKLINYNILFILDSENVYNILN